LLKTVFFLFFFHWLLPKLLIVTEKTFNFRGTPMV
jgi:hypothetical protein